MTAPPPPDGYGSWLEVVLDDSVHPAFQHAHSELRALRSRISALEAESAAYREALEALAGPTTLSERADGDWRLGTTADAELAARIKYARAALSRPGGERCECAVNPNEPFTHSPLCLRAEREDAGDADDRTLREAKQGEDQ